MEVTLLPELTADPNGILVLGSLTEDWVEAPGVVLEGELGGSAAYFALTARHFGPVAVVGSVGRDREGDVRRVLDFADLSGVTVTDEPTYAWHGRRAVVGGEAETLSRFSAGSPDYQPVLPADAEWPPRMFLASFDPQVQLAAALAAPPGTWIAGDTMDFFIQDQPDAVERVIERLSVLFVTNIELAVLTRTDDLAAGAAALVERHSLEAVVVKLGADGAWLWARDGTIRLPAANADVVDPTGCGDSLAAATLGRLKETGATGLDGITEALHWGIAAAAVNIEDIGMRAVERISRADLEKRVGHYRRQLG